MTIKRIYTNKLAIATLLSLTVGLVILGLLNIYDKGQAEKNADFINNNSSLKQINPDDSNQPNSDNQLIIGNKNAPVTMIEYADYKCPTCGELHQGAYKKLREEYIDTGQVNIVFRPYPVYAEDGARALQGSYCAKEQVKFTVFHDAVFNYMWDNHFKHGDYQKAIDTVLTDSVMKGILKKIDIDYDLYDQCLKSKKYEEAYLDDIYLAAPDDIRGTPSFVIAGQTVVGVQPYEVYKKLIEIELR